MLAKGKGYIPFEQLNSIFGLPEDAQIISAEILDGGIEFKILSKEAIKNKTVKSDSWSIRRFRPTLSTEDDVIIKNEHGDVVFSTKTIGVEAIQLDSGTFNGKAIKSIVIHKPYGVDDVEEEQVDVSQSFPMSDVVNINLHIHETKEIMDSGKKVKDIAREIAKAVEKSILQDIQRSYE
jgi:hypothetical protein